MANLQYPSIQTMQAKFCDDRTLESETIDVLLDLMLGKNAATSLSLSYAQSFEDRYDDMRHNLHIDINDLLLNIYNPLILSLVPKMPGQIGLDLPTWFNMENSESRIMFIAMDPLRDNANIQCPNSNCLCASISSPFGLHRKSNRENLNKGGRLALLLNHLHGANCGIYFTDCRKFFFYDKKTSNKISNNNNLRCYYLYILRQEIHNVFGGFSGKKLVVATGNEADNYCSKLQKDIAAAGCNYLHIPHITGARWSVWDNKYAGLNSSINKTEDLMRHVAYDIINAL